MWVIIFAFLYPAQLNYQMELTKQKREFILVLSTHEKLGSIVLPYLAESSSKPFISISERLTVFNLDQYIDKLPDYAIEMIRHSDEYTVTNIIKRFTSKKCPAKTFFVSAQGEYFNDFIRPFIDRHVDKILRMAARFHIPVYLDEGSPNLYPEALLIVEKEEAEPKFNFIKTEDGTRYILQIYHKEKLIKTATKENRVISYQPCWLLSNNRLLCFTGDFDGKKLEPFIRKEFIAIQKSAEKKYFEAFIKKNLKSGSVNAEGFDIINIEAEKKVQLSLEIDWQGQAVLSIYFMYGSKRILAGNKQDVFVTLKVENDNYVFYRFKRDRAWENQITAKLLKKGLKMLNENSLKLASTADDSLFKHYELIEWVSKHEAFIKSINAVVVQNIHATNYYLSTVHTDFKISMENDWFDIHAMVHFGTHYQIPFIRLREYILKDIREFPLPNGEIAILPLEWFAKYRDFLMFSEENNKNIRINKHHFQLVNESIGSLDTDFQEKIKNLNFNKDNSVTPPKSLKTKLRPYQLDGLKWMLFLNENRLGGILADDMGLGKTIQTLALLLTVQKKVPSLIIMPASLIHNWTNEIKRFAPSIKILNHTGIGRSTEAQVLKHHDLILTTYGTVRNDIAALKKFHFEYIILDESQAIKNPESRTSQAVNELESNHKLVLTGTPVENSLIDLWSQLNFLNKGLLGNLELFKNEYLFPLDRNKDEEIQKRLKKIIEPFILRRRKEEVAKDLPSLTEDIRYCEMSDQQRKFYETEKGQIRRQVLENIEKNGLGNSSIEILRAMMRLRQLSNHPIMMDDSYDGDSGKFDEVLRSIHNIVEEKNKVLVFSSFVKHLNIFAKHFESVGINYSMLTGSTKDREAVVNSFKNDQDTHVFLISIKAGGVGLNLTEADYVFLLDPWWNPAVEQQAISRAHRIGQSKNVFAYKFISKDTIEEKILKLQEKKKMLADTFVSSNNPLKDINKEEIVELFD